MEAVPELTAMAAEFTPVSVVPSSTFTVPPSTDERLALPAITSKEPPLPTEPTCGAALFCPLAITVAPLWTLGIKTVPVA